ncbi:MAG: hypothetical protein AB1405_06065, partial [Bdellovibrionota bacterium]
WGRPATPPYWTSSYNGGIFPKKNDDHLAHEGGHEKIHGLLGHLHRLGGFGRFYGAAGRAKEDGQYG